jgi:spermidine synthase
VTEWFEEALHPGLTQRLSMDRILFREKTNLQDLVIFENRVFGRVLALDGVVQTTEGDEFIYHEMLSHVPILAHGAASRVLIIGGGDGGMAREVLKQPSIEEVTMVEIDPSVVALCQAHLPSISAGAFDNPRLNLVIGNGAKFVEETELRWDVVIIDSTDPLGPGEVLFSKRFYKGCKRCLNPGGILVTQNGVPYMQGDEVRNSFQRLTPYFQDVWFYVASVPTYQGGHMAFGWGTDATGHRAATIDDVRERFKAAGFETRYYTPEVHVASFALPANILTLLT